MALSSLSSPGWCWRSSEEYRATAGDDMLPLQKFEEITDLLLENPNLNSSHLFRADILFDSAGKLKTKAEKEAGLRSQTTAHPSRDSDVSTDETVSDCGPPPILNSANSERTVVRRLIPRNQNLDEALEQTCFFYTIEKHAKAVIYVPHVAKAELMPWYHPKVRAMAYLYERGAHPGQSSLSIHFSPFERADDFQVPERLHRTLLSLLGTFLRLARHESNSMSGVQNLSSAKSPDTDLDLRPSAIKDTIIPQHIVQDTYARLKSTYATDLIAAWVEATPPDKHVFEDLSIAAFLVCLWQKAYGSPKRFPGFVDLACGNGLLVYILLQEGWRGFGLDARKRKTWTSLGLENEVQEKIIVPQPFLDKLDFTTISQGDIRLNDNTSTNIHSGIFNPGTFIIANHADELTIWTPLLATLSCPAHPLPFLNIPCCSHALSGEKHRYTPTDAQLGQVDIFPATPSAESDKNNNNNSSSSNHRPQTTEINNEEPQPSKGDLKTLRAQRTAGAQDKSMYACLTKKAVQISRQLSMEGELKCTLMRIPSTRNIGVVHVNLAPPNGIVAVEKHDDDDDDDDANRADGDDDDPVDERGRAMAQWRLQRVAELVERECRRSGGVHRSAQVWLQRARKLHAGSGRGKVNLGGPRGAEDVAASALLANGEADDRQRDRETERRRDRETERQRDGETERRRDRDTETQRQREND